MPPASKRQKLDNAAVISRHATQLGIRAFGTISKPLGGRRELGKSKSDGTKRVDWELEKAVSIGVNRLKRKRKSLPEQLVEEDLRRDCCLSSTAEPQDGQERIAADENELSTPLLQLNPKQPSKVQEKEQTPSPINQVCTPSGRACLELLPLAPSSPSDLNVISLSSPSSLPLEAPEPPHPSLLPVKSLSSHPHKTPDTPLEVPDEVQDLIDLYSSFLTTLSLHYAHNGWPTPADLRVLRPSVERAWRRKRVSIDDVRRILGIEQDISACSDGKNERSSCPSNSNSNLSLIDYGSGKICIEINSDSRLHFQGFPKRPHPPLDEAALNQRFAKNVMRQWTTYQEKNCKIRKPTPAAALETTFTSQLPLAPITLCTSLLKISPLLAKGQQRLEDLKAGAIRAQQKSSSSSSCSKSTSTSSSCAQKPPATTTTTAATTTTTRATNLLARIRAKQLHKSTLPPPPTQSSIARTSALNRIHEIIPVLELLTTTSSSRSKSPSLSPSVSLEDGSHTNNRPSPSSGLSPRRCSYTLPTIIQHLQTSLRNPISRDDARRCVRVLAEEVVPEWVMMKNVGSVECVVLRRGGEVEREVVRGRVERLLGGDGGEEGKRGGGDMRGGGVE